MSKILKIYFWYLYEGLTPLGSIFLFCAFWAYGSTIYGALVLPTPIETIEKLILLISSTETQTNLRITSFRLIIGVFGSIILAISLSIFSKIFTTLSIFLKPNMTLIMGVPPISWIVLSLLWFGFGNQTVIFSVIISTLPVLFTSMLIALNTLEDKYYEVCEIYSVHWIRRLYLYYIPFLFAQIFSSIISAISIGWKIVIMSELFVASDGLGSELAIYRSQLQTSKVMAIVLLMVLVLFILEYAILGPIKREVELWRS